MVNDTMEELLRKRDAERHQNWRLNVELTEWLMGLPAGWTDV